MKPLQPGLKYYFEVSVISGSPKVGVSRSTANINQVRELSKSIQAFSDGPDGWAIYNGELRHKSNSTGAKYGKQIQAGDIVGVMLDMIDV